MSVASQHSHAGSRQAAPRDIPEAAASGAVLLVNDGVHTVDPDPSNPYADPIPDPAYATLVNLAP